MASWKCVSCKRWLFVLALGSSTLFLGVGLAQNPPTRVRTKVLDSAPPYSCGLPLATLSGVVGSPAYIRLRYLLTALIAAQDSIVSLHEAGDSTGSATNVTQGMASLLTGAHQGVDDLHCAAMIMKKFPALDEDDKAIKMVAASAFEQEAGAVGDLIAHIKEQFVRSPNDQTSATKLHDAERIAAMNAVQNKAASDLLQMTTFALLRSVYMGDSEAKTTPFTTLSCEEHADLNKRNESLAHTDKSLKSAYTIPSEFIQTFLDGHTCRN